PPPPPPPGPPHDILIAGMFGGSGREQDQNQVANGAAFEAASIKPNTSGDGRAFLVPQPGGRLNGVNITTRDLVRFAFDIPDFRLAGGPDWTARVRFDVLAKAANGQASANDLRR